MFSTFDQTLFVQGLLQDINPVSVSLFVFRTSLCCRLPVSYIHVDELRIGEGRAKAARAYVTSLRWTLSCLGKVISDASAHELRVNVRRFQRESGGGGEKMEDEKEWAEEKEEESGKSAKLRPAHTNATPVSKYFPFGTSFHSQFRN